MSDRPSNISDLSHFFTLRIWVESTRDGNMQLRVQVKHVLSGATRTFREWSQVVACIEAKLQESEEDP